MKKGQREVVFFGVVFFVLICVIAFKIADESDVVATEQRASLHSDLKFLDEVNRDSKRTIVRNSKRFRQGEPPVEFRAEFPNGDTFAFVGKQKQEGRLHLGLITSQVLISAAGEPSKVRLLSKLVDIHKDFSGVTVIPELSQAGDGLILEGDEMLSRMRLLSQSKGVDVLTFPSATAYSGETISVIVSSAPDRTDYVDVTVVEIFDEGSLLNLGPVYSLPSE